MIVHVILNLKEESAYQNKGGFKMDIPDRILDIPAKELCESPFREDQDQAFELRCILVRVIEHVKPFLEYLC